MKKNWFDKVSNIFGGVSMLFMLLLMLFNILSDWTVSRKYGEVDELVLVGFVWVVYIGSGSIYKQGEEISVRFLIDRLPAKAKAVMLIVDDIVAFIISCLLTYYGWLLTAKSVNKLTQVLRISYWIIDLPLVIGFGSLSIYIVIKYINRIKQRNGGRA